MNWLVFREGRFLGWVGWDRFRACREDWLKGEENPSLWWRVWRTVLFSRRLAEATGDPLVFAREEDVAWARGQVDEELHRLMQRALGDYEARFWEEVEFHASLREVLDPARIPVGATRAEVELHFGVPVLFECEGDFELARYSSGRASNLGGEIHHSDLLIAYLEGRVSAVVAYGFLSAME